MAIELFDCYVGDRPRSEQLLDDLPDEAQARDIALLLEFWCGYTNDGGFASIHPTAEQWIRECDDERRIEVALNLKRLKFTYPDRAVTDLGIVAQRFPKLRTLCEELVHEIKNIYV